MGEQLAVRDHPARHPDATRPKEAIQPNSVHRLLGDAFQASQGHTGFQWWNSSDRLGKSFASHVVGLSADGSSKVYMGSRRIAGEGRLYGLLDERELSFDEKGKLKEKQKGNEKVYSTAEEIAELLGDAAEQHAARILWRMARDKNVLPEEIIRRADEEFHLVSIAPGKETGLAVVYIPDAKTGKMVRFITDKPLPTGEEENAALISEVRKIMSEPHVQKLVRERDYQVVDIIQKEKQIKVSSSEPVLLLGDKEKMYRGQEVVMVGEKSVALDYELLLPENTEQGEQKVDELNVLIPGWSLPYDTDSARKLAQAFSDEGNRNTLVANARVSEVGENDLYIRAQAIADLIKRQGVKKVTLTAHSQGGPQAVDVAYILQKEREKQIAEGIEESTIPEVEGIVFHDPVGLYKQGPVRLALGFTKDVLVTGATAAKEWGKDVGRRLKSAARTGRWPQEPIFHDAGKHAITGAAGAATDIGYQGMVGEMRRSGKIKDYGRRFVREVKDMADVPQDRKDRMNELNVPIVLIIGEKDPISNPEKFVPGYKTEEMTRMMEEPVTDEGGKVIEIHAFDPRELHLQEQFFEHSPYVRMVTAKHFPRHGLPLFRSKAVAKAGLGLLERSKHPEIYQAPRVPEEVAA